MDVRGMIARADSLLPNLQSFVCKAQWLYELDKKIYEDFLSSYGASYRAPDEENMTSPDRTLLIEDAFSDVYLYYLFMQTELSSGNITGYQNMASLFNRAYVDYISHFNRTHLMSPRRINIE